MSSCEPSLSSLQPSNHFPILTLTPLISSSDSLTVSPGAFGILFCQQPFIYPNRFSCLWISERTGWDLDIFPWQISFTVECVRVRSWLFATLWTATHQPPLSMGFSRQGYRSGLPSPTPGDLPDPGIKSPELACEFFTTKPPGKPASFTVGQIYILSPWLLDLLIKRYSGRNGLHQPFKKALSPSTRAMSTYLLRMFIIKRIYMKTLAWIFHPVTQS